MMGSRARILQATCSSLRRRYFPKIKRDPRPDGLERMGSASRAIYDSGGNPGETELFPSIKGGVANFGGFAGVLAGRRWE